MGSGEAKRYYMSHGSKLVHHDALIHSIDGKYTHDPETHSRPDRLKSGGHGQVSMEIMDANHIGYHVVHTYPNGVGIGYVPRHKYKKKSYGTGQTWFPRHWTTRDIVKAGEHVMYLKRNQGAPDRHIIWGTWKGVRVGVIKQKGMAYTIFPAEYQPSSLWKKKRP